MSILLCALLGLLQVDPPPTFVSDRVLLASTKAAQENDPGVKQAVTYLRQEANKALETRPYSVTYKEKTPPSGDKHDFMSVGPYWWPDSTKKDGLPYIRKDGQINPERYKIKDDDYFNSLAHDVYRLGLAWYYTGDKRYAEKGAVMLRTWFLDTATRMNPNLNYGQAIPGITEGRGIGVIDTHNQAMLIDGIQLLKGSPALSDADYKAIQEWYKQFLHWMQTSPIGLDEEDEKNNHGTWYDVQEVSIALFTEQPGLAKEILNKQTKLRIDSQFTADGRQPLELARTLSWSYSQMNLKAFFELALLAENVKLDLWHYESPDKKSIERAFLWMMPFAKGQAEWTYQQIKTRDDKDYAEMAKTAARHYKNVDVAALEEKHRDMSYLLTLTNWVF
jgi:hypothetical protein